MRFHRCQNCYYYEMGCTTTMVGKTVFKRTHTHMNLPIKLSRGCFDSVIARRQNFLSALLYHKAHTLRSWSKQLAPPLSRTWKLPSLEDFSPKVEDSMAYLFHNSK